MWLNKRSSSHGEYDSSYKLLAGTGLPFLRLAVDIPSYFYFFLLTSFLGGQRLTTTYTTKYHATFHTLVDNADSKTCCKKRKEHKQYYITQC